MVEWIKETYINPCGGNLDNKEEDMNGGVIMYGEWLDRKCAEIMKELGTDDLDEAIRILEAENK